MKMAILAPKLEVIRFHLSPKNKSIFEYCSSIDLMACASFSWMDSTLSDPSFIFWQHYFSILSKMTRAAGRIIKVKKKLQPTRAPEKIAMALIGMTGFHALPRTAKEVVTFAM